MSITQLAYKLQEGEFRKMARPPSRSMQQSLGTYEFAAVQTTYPDGIRSNFVFTGEAMARPLTCAQPVRPGTKVYTTSTWLTSFNCQLFCGTG